MQAYDYQAVSEDAFEVRFLILLPGERDDPVQGLLLSRPLTTEDFPSYEALSYTWGSPEDPKDIAIRTTDAGEVALLLSKSTSDSSSRVQLRSKGKKAFPFFKSRQH